MKLFNQCIDNSEPSERLRKRLKNLMSYTTYFVYVSVCRGLFEEHKLLFSLLVCTSIMRVMTVQEKIDEANVGDAEESDVEDEDEEAKPEGPARSVPAVMRRVERLLRHIPQLRGTSQDCGVAHGLSGETCATSRRTSPTISPDSPRMAAKSASSRLGRVGLAVPGTDARRLGR